jgi:hypothetical protein
VCDLFVTPSEGLEEPVKVRDAGEGVYECDYYPIMTGKYTITITWGGQTIPRRYNHVLPPILLWAQPHESYKGNVLNH